MSNEEIRVVIADDEPGMRMIMRKMIEKAVGFTLCGEADNGPDLLKLVEQYKPQVCFLDVEMPGMTGLECAKAIQDTDPRTILVFATAHDDYMAQAFEVYAFDYMVKPFKVERVMKRRAHRQVIGGARAARASRRKSWRSTSRRFRPEARAAGIMLHHKEGVNFINQSDILLVQRENRSTVLYATNGRRFETSEALGDVEARLDPKIFFRCHKSYIINLNVIDNITPYGRWTYVVHLTGTTQDADYARKIRGIGKNVLLTGTGRTRRAFVFFDWAIKYRATKNPPEREGRKTEKKLTRPWPAHGPCAPFHGSRHS